MPPISLLIKPSSSSCNLSCKYCFYNDVSENRVTKNYGMMSLELLELMVKRALDDAEHACSFAFQGGEPTLVGLAFYKKLVEFENKYNVKKLKIKNAIQTNGMVIDEEWAKFLAENKFLVGISLDGPKEIHDENRVDGKHEGSFNRVMHAIKLFDQFKVEYNILFVVNGYVARHSNKIYSFFKKNNFKYLQFIPCLEPFNELPGESQYSLSPSKYVDFLKKFLDLWYEDISKGNIVSVRYFDNLVGIFMGYKPEACGMLGECQCQYVVESDGGIYPCDFYVFDEWFLGNIKDFTFEELRKTDNVKRFIETSKSVNFKCRDCKWFKLCLGGCRRDRESFGSDQLGLNKYCEAYKEFYEYSVPRLKKVAEIFMYGKC